MSGHTVGVEVVRALYFRGQRVEAGARLEVAPVDAAALVDSGRARLSEQSEAPALEQARRAELARSMHTLGQRATAPVEDPRWTPR